MKKILLCLLVCSQASLSDVMSLPMETASGATEQYCDGLLLLNQVPNQLDAKAIDLDCNVCGSGVQVMADNFRILTDGYISELVLYIGYLNSNVPLENDEWTINIHRTILNQPGAILYSEINVASTRTATGVPLFGSDEYRILLTPETPISLEAGIYWIDIHNNSTASTDTVFWGTGSAHVNSITGVFYSNDYPALTWNVDNTNYLSLQLCDVVSDTIYLDGFEFVIED